MEREISATLGLALPRRLWTDRAWWLLLVGGLLTAVAVFPVSGLDPLPSLPTSAVLWGAVLLWQPLVEELSFRGLLQGLMREWAWGRRDWAGISIANLGTTLPFALLHLVYHPPLWAAAVVAPSLVFGWLRDRHDSVWPALIAHVVFNTGFFLSAWWTARGLFP
ncbi:MAG TPA: JDVT-CTERM system glutamic-type intramembrane protease [Gammaproteobacteria bacterium]|nr:JDVT-CTERM system glutamic-type intramembrane protease [Gammaproteobacteria bacterium]